MVNKSNNDKGGRFIKHHVHQIKSKCIEVIDLTFNNQGKKLGDKMFYLWPFLAACYVEAPRVVDEKLGKINYKAEYIFPQAFASYLISRHQETRGIVYYSVRNKLLMPEKSDYNNVVLFTDKKPFERYDTNLMEMFEIVNIGNL